MAETQGEGFICKCGGTFRFCKSVFAIHGLEWDYVSKGYHPERDNPVGEIKHDMKIFEQNLTHKVHNLKDHRRGMKALKSFERAHRGILK